MREPFFQKLEKKIIVCDGAMGTMLYSKGIPLSRCYDELNLGSPQIVKDVHLGLRQGRGGGDGDQHLWRQSSFAWKRRAWAEKVREINLAGARLAREVAGDDLYVAGAVGPLGVHLEPLGPTSLDEARAAFREQIAALVEGGVDLIVIETMRDLDEAHQALLAAREASSFLSWCR